MQTQLNSRTDEGRRKSETDRRKQSDRRSGLDRRLEEDRRSFGEYVSIQVNDREFPQAEEFKPDASDAAWERRTSNDRRGVFQIRGPAEHVLTDNEIRFLLGSGQPL